MGDEIILENDQLLKGSRVATVSLRPLKLAYLVPEGDPQIALRAIESCTLTWGGFHHALVPYSKSVGLTKEWREMLDILDPDHLIDAVGISEADKALFMENNQFVHEWKEPLSTFFTDGALVYSALNAFSTGLKSQDSKLVVVNPVLKDPKHPMYLPLLARYGRLNESFMDERLKWHGWLPSVRYSQFVDVEDVEYGGQIDALLYGLSPALGRGGSYRIYKPIDMTRRGLVQRGPSYSFGSSGSSGTPEKPQYDEAYCNCVIVTGAATSVSDLALYWNLRSERHFAAPFPLWIPIEVLETAEGKEILTSAFGMIDQRTREGLSGKSELYVVSSSVEVADLTARLAGLYPEAKYATNNFARFLSGTTRNFVDEHLQEIHFRSGTVRVAVPKPTKLEPFASRDRIDIEIAIDGVHLPKTPSLRHELGQRITRSGSLEQFAYVEGWPPIVDVAIPSGWTVLTAVLKDHGYSCTRSDKSRAALGLLNLVGGVDNVCVLASSKVHDKLKNLSRVRGAGRTYFERRPVEQFSQFAEAWGMKQAKVVLQWLVEKRVLFRGANLRCPVCDFTQWYSLDHIGEDWRCSGCQSNAPIPLDLDSTTWSYRVNELYARGHDQGALAHVLTIFSLLSFGTAIAGYYPGIVLKAIPGARVPESEVELDVVGIRDGKLIVAECKDSGDKLSEQEISRLVNVANHLNCSRLLFVTTTKFSDSDADALFGPYQPRSSARLEWWEASDVFDQSAGERLGAAPTDSVEERPDKYLESIVRVL